MISSNYWIKNSGVLINSENSLFNGGVSAGFDLRANKWNFIYNEITGYMISTNALLYKSTNDNIYLDNAIKSSEYLISNQYTTNGNFESGAFPKGYSFDDSKIINVAYSFDVAMIVQGLLDLYDITKSKKLLNSAILGADWLIKMQDSSGFFYAKYDIQVKEKRDFGPFFYNDAGCLHAKHAIALLKLYNITGNIEYRNSAKLVCDWVIDLQDSDGSFWVNLTKSHVYAHSHAYALEGLLYAYNHFNDDNYLKAIKKGCEWAATNLNKRSYSILGTNKVINWFRPIETSSTNKVINVYRSVFPRKEIAVDATIQISRIFYFYYILTGDEKFIPYANNILNIFVPKAIVTNKSVEVNGALTSRIIVYLNYFRKSSIFATWPTQFYIGAENIYKKIKSGSYSKDLINDLF